MQKVGFPAEYEAANEGAHNSSFFPIKQLSPFLTAIEYYPLAEGCKKAAVHTKKDTLCCLSMGHPTQDR